MQAFGGDFHEDARPCNESIDIYVGISRLTSLDLLMIGIGNMCDVVPGFHCAFSIGTDDPKNPPHTPGFAAAAATEVAVERALDCGKGMAATAYGLLANAGIAADACKDFDVELKGLAKL